ncbi:DUF47 domain-containing protein [Anaeromicropila herbilytica]|nr:DUF47 family protein [Anaeromicropila herbilytica]
MAKKNEYNYFDQFVKLEDYSCKCAEILHETLSNFKTETLGDKLKEIHKIEHSADLAKHDMMNRLASEFITPIEREDIMSLSQKIDDITDAVEDVLIKIHMFNISVIRPEVLEFTGLIVKCCESLNLALKELYNFKKSDTLNDKVIEVNHLEENGDVLYYDSVHELFTQSKDPVELLVWTEIFNRLEKCCDACESAANDIESIVMKNS